MAQRVYEISGVRVGGLPGVNPVLLVGSIFYSGDRLLERGDGTAFDRARAREELEEALSLSGELALQFAVDVIFPSVESVDHILPFMAEFDNLVLFLDSPDPKCRVRAYRLSGELGLSGRAVANGIYTETSKEELEAIRDVGIDAAVLLAFDPRSPHRSMAPRDRLRILEERLLHLAREAGVEKLLVDLVVLDPASIGSCASAIKLVKETHGLPSGCAPANALGPVSKKRFSEAGAAGIHGGAAALLRCYGADYIMYGPVRRLKYVAPALAMVDSLLSVIARERGVKPREQHPAKALLRRLQQLFINPE